MREKRNLITKWLVAITTVIFMVLVAKPYETKADDSTISYSGNGWYYYKNGTIDYSYTGLASNENGWWYVNNGQVDFDYYGVVYNEYGWWVVYAGAVNFNYTGLASNEYGWWYIENGRVNFDGTGLVENEAGWWYVINGAVRFDYTGLASNEYGWWAVQGGKINFDYTGLANNEYGWWAVQGGKVNFDYTGLANNEYGWWYVNDGWVNFNYTGLAWNDFGRWYIVNGQVDFSYSGNYEYNGDVWVIAGGKVKEKYENGTISEDNTIDNGNTSNSSIGSSSENANNSSDEYTGLVNDNGKIYYVVNGTIADFTGVVADTNGQKWYFVNGIADMTYNGRKYYAGNFYDIVNSKAEVVTTGVKGIDVSSWNDVIDWDRVKADGVEFAIIRIGHGIDDESKRPGDKNDGLDRLADRNMDECERLGIPYGVYYYSLAVSTEEAQQEADIFLSRLVGRNPEIGVYIDVEDSQTYEDAGIDYYGEEGRQLITDIANTFMDKVDNAGYMAGIYANLNYFKYILHSDQIKYNKWLAAWNRVDGCPAGSFNEQWFIWQHTSDDSVDGIEEPDNRCDMNLFFGYGVDGVGTMGYVKTEEEE